MIELLIALAVFLIVSGAALSLFNSHVQLFTSQQNQSTLNFTLRNAMAQMQIDVVNAGNGFYPGPNIAAWPAGIRVVNHNAGESNCYDATTRTYGPNCFDELHVIAMDLTIPLAHPTDSGANCVSTTSSTLFGTPVSGTLTALASAFHKGDQVLLISSDGSQMTSVVLTKDAQVTGGKVKFDHNPTGANGLNTAADDPFGISTAANNNLGAQFCNDDWILKLSPSQSIIYKVDASDPSDPKLVRAVSGQQEVIADQIIGFKVGASIKNGDSDFFYDTGSYNADWPSIRAVRITLIARTPPLTGANAFENSFDHGPYKVEAVSTVINPRNLSMND
jgi:type II secretory pathway pseudopilin PulG